VNNILTKERLAQIVAEERANLQNTQEDECKANKAGLGKDLGAIDSGLKVCDKNQDWFTQLLMFTTTKFLSQMQSMKEALR